MAAKKKPPYNWNAVARGALRRAFARSPIVQEKLNQSRREVPRYKNDGTRAKKNAVQRQCEVCGNWVGSTKLVVDHIVPVVSVEDGYQNLQEFSDRLCCPIENLQRICKDPCHSTKTQAERISRLRIRYAKELDAIESVIANAIDAPAHAVKQYKKDLAKYISKRKTLGLEDIALRASLLRDNLLKYHKII